MRSLGNPFKIVLRYLQPYEREVIDLLECNMCTYNLKLLYLCAMNNWTAAFVLFITDQDTIIRGAIEGGHDQLFLTWMRPDYSGFISDLAATYNRLNVLKLFSVYNFNTALSAVKNCHVECATHIIRTSYSRLSHDNLDRLINTIDYSNSRSAQMLGYLQSALRDPHWSVLQYYKKIIEIAIYQGDIGTLKLCAIDYVPDVSIAVEGGHMRALEWVLQYSSDKFLVHATRHNRVDMIQLAVSRGETDFQTAAAVAIKNDHVEAVTWLIPHISLPESYVLACARGSYKIVKLLSDYAVPQGLQAAIDYKQTDIIELINRKFQE